jgi:hypothetical protein
MRRFIAIAYQLRFIQCHYEGSPNTRGTKVDATHALLVSADSVNLLGKIYIPESKTHKLY